MSRRYTTTLSLSIGGDEPTWEGEATVSYEVNPEECEVGPAYDHGGLPYVPAEAVDVTVTHLDGRKLGTTIYDREMAATLEDHIECSDDLMAELLTDALASDQDAREYAAETRAEARWETL